MKILKKKKIMESNQVEHIKSERRILERLRHPFIVRLAYAFKDREKLFFVLNYCPGGELFFYLSNVIHTTINTDVDKKPLIIGISER